MRRVFNFFFSAYIINHSSSFTFQCRRVNQATVFQFQKKKKKSHCVPWESSVLSNTNNTENNRKNHGSLIVQENKKENNPEKIREKKNEDIEQPRNIQQQHVEKIKVITMGNMGQ